MAHIFKLSRPLYDVRSLRAFFDRLEPLERVPDEQSESLVPPMRQGSDELARRLSPNRKSRPECEEGRK